MYLFGIKCPICQAEKDMPVDELSLHTNEEETSGTICAYARCMQCDSKFKVTIPAILGPEFTMQCLDQNSQTQPQVELSEAPPTCEYP